MWRILLLTAAVAAAGADPPKDDATKKDPGRLHGYGNGYGALPGRRPVLAWPDSGYLFSGSYR